MVVVVEVVDVLVELGVFAGAGVVEPVVGTVNGGEPVVSVDAAPPPPQPAAPTARAAPVVTVASRRTALAERIRRMPGRSTSSLRLVAERFHPPATVRTVVEVLLRELIAVVAEPEVLDGPRKLRCRRRQRQELRDRLELLAGFTVDVFEPRLGLEDHFPARGGGPHPVFLEQPH